MFDTISLTNRTAVITGASSGIGEASARRLAESGVSLILIARRLDRIEKLAAELTAAHGISCHTRALDVRNRDEVTELGTWITSEKLSIDFLINNAGLARGMEKMHEGNMDDWDQMIDTNIKGLLYMTRTLVPIMLETSDQPQVINIGSTAGIQAYAGGGVYSATKTAVGFITDGLRIDSVATPLKVCNIRPGMVETEFSVVRFHGDKNRADGVYKGFTPLYADDIASAVVYVLSRPENVQISELTIMPRQQANGTVVHRE